MTTNLPKTTTVYTSNGVWKLKSKNSISINENKQIINELKKEVNRLLAEIRRLEDDHTIDFII